MTTKKEATTNSLTTPFSMKLDNALKDVLLDRARAGGVTLTTTITILLKYALKHSGKKTLATINKELL